MAIEPEDLELLKQIRYKFPDGDKCAILGDCHAYVANGLNEVAQQLKFQNIDTFDINGNPSYKIDLNYPIDRDLYGRYNVVIDSGTLYCCFDICTVWQNILNILVDDGCVIHTGNLSGFFGRGFYSLSPALFRDFYNANGFTIHLMASKTRQERNWQSFDPNHTYLLNTNLNFQEHSGDYVPKIPNDAMICCFAKRTHRAEFTKPIPQHFIDTNGG